MNTKTLAYWALSTVAVIALLAGDLAPWLAARNEFVQGDLPSAMQARERAITADMASYGRCNSMRTSGAHELTSKARDCLVETMPKIETSEVAIAIANVAAEWLYAHSEDAKVREAAFEVVARGRSALIREKSWYYDRLAKLAEARNQSLSVRIVHGHRSTTDMFLKLAGLLDLAEFALIAPEVARRQSQWLVQAVTSSGAAASTR